MSFLDDLMGKLIKRDGVALPQRKVLNIIPGAGITADIEDNPATGETDMTLGASPVGTSEIEDGAVTEDKIADEAVTTDKIFDTSVTFAKLQPLAGLSVIGLTSSGSGVAEEIIAGTDGHILRRLGSVLDFGKILTSMITGTATNNNATAGDIGEYVQSIVTSDAAVSFTAGAAKDITSIALTAGDWDVTGIAAVAGATSTNYITAWIDTVANTQPAGGLGTKKWAGFTSSGFQNSVAIPTYRVSISATTTVYLGMVLGPTGTLTGYGRISARRVR